MRTVSRWRRYLKVVGDDEVHGNGDGGLPTRRRATNDDRAEDTGHGNKGERVGRVRRLTVKLEEEAARSEEVGGDHYRRLCPVGVGAEILRFPAMETFPACVVR